MGVRLYTDITIRGVTYPTAQAAAKALGVTDQAVRLAVRKGCLDRVGDGLPKKLPCPVRIRGKDYPSAKAAAKALGVKISTVFAALADGDPDRINQAPRYAPAKSIPFTIGGVTYPSRRAASVALGFNPDYVQKVLSKGYKRGREKIVAAAMSRSMAANSGARSAPPTGRT